MPGQLLAAFDRSGQIPTGTPSTHMVRGAPSRSLAGIDEAGFPWIVVRLFLLIWLYP